MSAAEQIERIAHARHVARVASELLISIRANEDSRDGGSGVLGDERASALRAEGDRRAHVLIAEAIRERFPDDVLLSEEAADDARRLTAERVWIVDPLDGTREFGERDAGGRWRDDFAVHLALWERGLGLTIGVVALPAHGLIFGSDAPPTLPPASLGPLRIAASRTRPPSVVAHLEASGGATLVPMGSAGVKVMAVLRGNADAYVHAGGQYQWDSAAPVAVALSAGLCATRLDGSPLEYNVPELHLPDLLVCHPDRATELRARLRAAGVPAGDGAPASAAESAG